VNISRNWPAFFVTCALLSGAAVVVSAQKYGVTVNAEKNVDFTKFKTYSWTTGLPSPDKTVDGHIVAAVDKELGSLGLTKASGNPDVLVTYYSTRRVDVDVNAKPDASGKRPERAVGTLIVGLVEPANRKQVLRLRTDKPVDLETNAGAAIDAAVTELFAKYPTRTKK
jgi:Domain of unknown function (DUF4136)